MTAPSPDAARVLSYLRSDKGQRDRRNLMHGRGYSYERAVAEIVVYVLGNCGNGRLRFIEYERITAITDECIIAELGRAEEPQRCA